MNFSFNYLAVRANRIILLCIVLFLILRGIEPSGFAAELLGEVSGQERFAAINDTGIASFVYVPLFCFYIAPSAKYLLNESAIVLHGARGSVASRFLSLSALQSFLYTLVITGTSLPPILLSCKIEPEFFGYILIAIGLQVIFFIICSLLFYVVLMLTRMMLVAYVATIAYGLWDFMASFTVGGGLPFLGWSRTSVNSPIAAGEALPNFILLAIILCILLLVSLAATKRTDFLGRVRYE